MSASQYEYWCHTQLVIDVVPGRGGMFSLEGPQGLRFLTRSRLYTDEEWNGLLVHGKVRGCAKLHHHNDKRCIFCHSETALGTRSARYA